MTERIVDHRLDHIDCGLTEKQLEDYLMWLRKNKIKGIEAVCFENFASSVMEMKYQLLRLDKALDGTISKE